MSLVIRDVMAVGPDGIVPGRVDVVIEGARIARLVPAGTAARGDAELDGGGRALLPGFVDAHSHADGVLFDPDVQHALLRQGITTVVGGQDGVSYAPGDGGYAAEYFAAINGPHPTYAGGGMAQLLASYDGTTRLNAAMLVPAGTVRHEVCGRRTGAASAEERTRMRRLVAQGLDDGAVGLSSGLDYVPGIFADADELAELARPAAAVGAPYVTHLRGGYEENSAAGIAELARIALAGGARVHVSHFHARPALVHELMQSLADDGVDATFDAYPYGRGCSLLSMTVLPPELAVLPTAEIVERLADQAACDRLIDQWFPAVARHASLGSDWPELMTFAHLAADQDRPALGRTIGEAARAAGVSAPQFALDVLRRSRLEVSVVMTARAERTRAELAEILGHPQAIGGSDGIFVGQHPHPRARGAFARYLRTLVREDGVLDLPHLVQLASTRACDRFALGPRGRLRPGAAADLVLVDLERVRDAATYTAPLQLAEGIDDVLVAGRPVLCDGELTTATPGRGIRRAGAPAHAS